VGFEDTLAADLAAEGVPEAEHVAGVAARMPGKRVSAGALFRDAAGRVLVLEPTYKPRWEIPGGVVEAGEEPFAACVREVREELGVDLAVGGLLVVDWAPAWGVWGDSVNFVFDGGVLDGAALRDAVPQADEVRAWRFEPLDVVARHVGPAMARRLSAAWTAASASPRHPEYLRFGRRLGP
jgi:8-oxo-dGTP pyrophosphatase MutT (NUDIX family)